MTTSLPKPRHVLDNFAVIHVPQIDWWWTCGNWMSGHTWWMCWYYSWSSPARIFFGNSIIESKFETPPIMTWRENISPFRKLFTIICETLTLQAHRTAAVMLVENVVAHIFLNAVFMAIAVGAVMTLSWNSVFLRQYGCFICRRKRNEYNK